MNKIYKLVWSKVRNAWVVASEIAKGHGKNASAARERKLLKTAVITAIMGGCLMTGGLASAAANPAGTGPGIAIGQDSHADNATGISIGKNAKTNKSGAMDAIAIGHDAEASNGSIVIGANAKDHEGDKGSTYGVIIGNGAHSLGGGTAQVILGAKAHAKGSEAMAFGSDAKADGEKSITIGFISAAEGDFATALGGQAKAIGESATAVGFSAKALAKNTVALGYGAQSTKVSGLALGHHSAAETEYGVALSSWSKADRAAGVVGYLAGEQETNEWKSSVAAVAVGNKEEGYTRQITGVAAGSENTDAVNVAQLKALNNKVDKDAIHYVSVTPVNKEQTGESNYFNDGAKGDGGIAIGEAATSQGRGIAMGYKSKAVPKTGATVNPNAFEGIAIGQEADMEVPGGIAIGLRSKVEGTLNTKDGEVNVNELGTIALGTDSYAKGNGAAAFGWKAKGNGEGAMAFGTETKAKESGTAFGGHAEAAAGGVAVGWQAHAHDLWAMSIGTSSDAKGKYSTALGGATTAEAVGSTAVGFKAVSKGVLSTAVGAQSVAEESGSVALGADSVANTKAGKIGYIATGSSVTFEDALKTLNKKEDYDKWTAKVNESKAEYDNLTKAFEDAQTKDKKAEAKAALDAWKGQHADFIEALTKKEKLEATWRATKAAVSVGADGVDKAGNKIIESRQITNVAAGTRDTDAVNVAQLKALDTKVEGNKIHYLSIGPDNEKNLAKDGNYNNDGADSHWGIAIGVNASSKGGGSIAIGKGSQAHGTEEHRAQGVSIGSASRAIGAFATAVGHDTKAFGERSVAYGLGEAYGRGSIAIGSGAVAALKEGITKEEYNKLSDEEKAWYGKADYDDQKIFYQFRHKGKDGKAEDIKNYGMAIGTGATSFDNAGLAVGLNAKTNKDFGVAIGGYSENKVEQGVALGTSSVADREKGSMGYLPTTGKAIENFEEAMKATGKEKAFKELKGKYLAAQEKLAKAQEAYKADQSPTNMMNLDKAQKELAGLTEEYAIMTAPWTSRRGAVSVGNDKTGFTRQITGVAAGSEDSDAVNVAQLKALNTKVDKNTTDITELTTKIKNAGGVHYFSVNSDDKNAPDGTNWDNDGATGENAIAIGRKARAYGMYSQSMGDNAWSIGNYSQAWGYYALAGAEEGISKAAYDALSDEEKKNYALRELSIGGEDKSLYYRTTFKEYTNDEFNALSEQERKDLQSNKGYGYHSGKKVWTPTPRAIAIGHLSKAIGAATVAVGNLAEATGLQSTAIGTQANASGENSFAAGDRAKAQKTGTVAIGLNTNASGEWSTAVGSFAEASGEWGTALGLSAKAQSKNGVAVGASTLVDKKDAVSLGYKAKGKVESGVALGAYSVADREKGKIGYALGGDNSTLEKTLESIGQKAKYDELTGKINPLKDEYNGLLKAYLDAPRDSAEEKTAKEKLDAWKVGHPDFLPAVKERQQMMDAWQSGNGAVSVGEAGGTRQITHVAAGSEDTDAVNVAQLKVVNEKADKNATDITNLTKTVNDNGKATKVTVDGKEENADGNLTIKRTEKDGQLTYDLSLNDELTIGKDGKDGKIGINGKDGKSAEITVGKGEPGVDGKDGVTRIIYKDKDGKNHEVATLDDGLKFKGDNDTVVTRKLNQQLNITGGIKNAADLSDGNIGIVGTQDGGMKVKLSKNLKGLSSAEFKDGDNITNITAGDISITKKEGDKTKTLNIWELKETVENNSKATKVTVDGKEESTDGNLKITKKTKDGQTTYDLSLNDELTIGKDGKDGKIGINGKDGKSAEITVGKGEPGVDGKDGVTRIIYKDKDGKNHEVATLDDGLKFKGDNNDVVIRKLNTQLNITGGAKADELSDNNIGVVGTAGDNGGMKVKLSKNLKGLTSAEFKDGDNITNITAGDISITKKEGDKTKTLNIWELKEKVDAGGKPTKVTVDGKETKADGNLKITKKEKDGQATYDISLSNQLDLKEKGSIKLGDHKKRGVVINGNEIGVLDYEKNENSVVISSKAGIAVGNPNSRIQIKGDRIDMGGKNIYNLKDGEISETSKQAVNGSQLHATNNRVTNLETKVTNIETTVNNIDQKIEQKIEGSKITVDGDKDTGVKATAIKNGDKVTGYKVSLDKKVTVGNVTIDGTGEGTDKKGEITGLTNTTLDGNDFATKGRAATEEQLKAAMGKAMAQSRTTVKGSENITVTPDKEEGAAKYTVELAKDINVDSVTAKTVKAGEYKVGEKTYINDKGINANDNKIINVGDGKISKDSTDAVNGKQLYGVEQKVNQNTTNINKLQNNIYDMGMKVGELDTRVNKVGAGAAALAALHPQDFDPEDKWDIAAGVGNYKNATAAAVGLFYRPNERTMLNLGWTMGDSRNMVNAGVSVKLGSGSTYAGLSKVQMATRLTQQEEKITAQEQEIKELREREEQREKQIQEILSKLEMIEKAKA